MRDKRSRNVGVNILLYGVFVFYALLLVIILFRTQHPTRSVNLIPFRGIVSYLSGEDLVSKSDNAIVLHAFSFINLLGNIVIFVPLGVYLTLFNRCKRVWKNTLWVLAISASVEVIQFIFKIGIGDIDDIILNTVGGLIGCLLCRLVYLIYKDDFKVQRFIAIAAPIVGIVSFAILIIINR